MLGGRLLNVDLQVIGRQHQRTDKRSARLR